MAAPEGRKRRAADSFTRIRTNSSPVSGHENRSSLFIEIVHPTLLTVWEQRVSNAVILRKDVIERLFPRFVVAVIYSDRNVSQLLYGICNSQAGLHEHRIRASKNSSEATTSEALERKLLRGDAFAEVASVNAEALEQLLASFSAAGDAVEYRPQLALTGADTTINEADALKAKKQRLENALSRLNALYLYDDEAMPEKDFVMQHGQITTQLKEVNARLSVLQAQGSPSELVDDDFIRKASYYIMANKLIEDRYIDYEKYIRAIATAVPKSFLSQIIDHIDADDGRVTAITFKNGIEHRFTYR